MTVEIICADARDALAAMPDGSVHACITSPPYWGLRDYGIEPVVWGDEDCEHEWGEPMVGDTRDDNFKDWTNLMRAGEAPPEAPHVKRSQGAFCRRCNAWRGSLGLEPTPELYVEHVVQVMREVRRVLRDDGTLWLNLGDSYAASRSGPIGENSTLNGSRHAPAESRRAKESAGRPNSRWRFEPWGLKPKDLCGMPWRVAFALQADGWWLRSDIVWSKPNPMPESVTDRPTRSHEYVFLLSKSARYYYDQDAIREPAASGPSDIRKMLESKERIGGRYKDAEDPLMKASGKTNIGRKRAVGGKPYRSGNKARKDRHDHGGNPDHDGHQAFGVPWEDNGLGRNRRSVWEIATQPYPGAHFAVFPEKLVEPCILAGCPEGGTVLDPFAGSGTVGLVAERLGRHSALIDASEDYCRMARERTAQMGLMEAAR